MSGGPSSAPERQASTLLLFNYAIDRDHVALSFAIEWVRRLAERFDRVVVITGRLGEHDLPANVEVHSLGGETGTPRLLRILRLWGLVLRTLAGGRVRYCFSHMILLPAILSWPLLKVFGVRLTAWYAHGTVNREVRVIARLADAIVTSSPAGFNIDTPRRHIVGQGIDLRRFSPAEEGAEERDEVIVVSTGRLSVAKRLHRMIEAVGLAARKPGGERLRLHIVGSPLPGEEQVETDLRAQVAAAGLDGMVRFMGPVRYDAVPDCLRAGDVMLNLSSTGSMDKAVIEAMSCGLPVVVGNNAFREMLAPWRDLCWVDDCDDAAAVADRLLALAAMPAAARRTLGLTLREVAQEHDLDRLVDRITAVVINAADRPSDGAGQPAAGGASA